jgi:hypothetical protein
VYKRARYYDPATGEFISRDPLEYVDGMSQYRAYFVPKGMDPLGLFLLSPADAKYFGYLIWREVMVGGRNHISLSTLATVFLGSNRWQLLMDDWYWEIGLNPRIFTGISNGYNRDIAKNVGFKKLVRCWLALVNNGAKIPKGRWRVNALGIQWQYTLNRNQAAGGIAAFTPATEFLGTYSATLTVVKNANGKCDVTVAAWNISGWTSATRIPGRFKKYFGKSIFKNHARGAGGPWPWPSRGGNMTQFYNFVLKDQECCPKCVLP